MATLRRSTPDYMLLLTVLTLLTFGLIMVASASTTAGLRLRPNPDAFHYTKKQLVFALIGLAGLFLAMNVDYHRLRRLSVPLIVITPILLGLVLILGQRTFGAKRWIDLGFFNFQPSEFAKVALVLVLAHYLSELGDGVYRFWQGIAMPFLFTSILALLIMAEPDMGTTIILCATCFCMVFAAGVRLWQLGFPTASAVVLLYFYAKSAPYRWERLKTFFGDPFADPQGSGYQIIQSLYALGSGGPFGVGIGRSRQKFSYLPQAHTDYIFSIVGEELGLIGTLFILALFFLLIWRGLRCALAAKDLYGSLLAVGLTSLFGLQAILNIGVVTATLPVTGITLPLISYGGSSLIPTLIGLGILLNISKQSC